MSALADRPAAPDPERHPAGVAEILDKALDGERITDAEALALLAVARPGRGRPGRQRAPRRAAPIPTGSRSSSTGTSTTRTSASPTATSAPSTAGRATAREGYLLPKPVIYKKIEETLALGGTGLLMQGGHHPDLGIDYYEDLFRSIKARYTVHLHALSPPEIQHISRRSRSRSPTRSPGCATPASTRSPAAAARSSSTASARSIAPKKTKRPSG